MVPSLPLHGLDGHVVAQPELHLGVLAVEDQAHAGVLGPHSEAVHEVTHKLPHGLEVAGADAMRGVHHEHQLHLLVLARGGAGAVAAWREKAVSQRVYILYSFFLFKTI